MLQGGEGRDKNSKSLAKGNFLLAATLWNNYMALSSWIVTSHQQQRVTSGWITYSKYFDTSSKHQSLSHKFVSFTGKVSKTNHISINQWPKTHVLVPIFILGALTAGTGFVTEQGDLFYSAGLHEIGNCINLPKLMQLKSRERIWKNEGDWSGTVSYTHLTLPTNHRV